MSATPVSEGRRHRPLLLRPEIWAIVLGSALTAFAAWRFALGIIPILREGSLSLRTDFVWYQVAFHTVWRGLDPARNLYDLTYQRAWVSAQRVPFNSLDLYSYPPQFAVVFAPFGALPYKAARQLWTFFTLLAFLTALVATAVLAAPGRPRIQVALGALGLLCFPALTALYWGQDDTIIAALLAIGLSLVFGRRQPWIGGALLGMAAVLKLTPAIVVVYLLLRGWQRARWADGGAGLYLRAGGGAVTAAILSVPATALVVGWRPFATYLTSTLPAIEAVAFIRGPAPLNQSFRGVLALAVHSPSLLTLGSLAFAAIVCLGLLLRAAGGMDHRLEAAGAALLPLLCSPSLEAHHIVLAAVPEVLVAGTLLERAVTGDWQWGATLVWALGVVLLAIPGHPFVPAVGTPLFGAYGQGLLPLGSNLAYTLSDGQHFWALVLLYGAVVAARGTNSGADGGRSPFRPYCGPPSVSS